MREADNGLEMRVYQFPDQDNAIDQSQDAEIDKSTNDSKQAVKNGTPETNMIANSQKTNRNIPVSPKSSIKQTINSKNYKKQASDSPRTFVKFSQDKNPGTQDDLVKSTIDVTITSNPLCVS